MLAKFLTNTGEKTNNGSYARSVISWPRDFVSCLWVYLGWEPFGLGATLTQVFTARTQSGRVTQRCHNSPRWETGASKCEWRHAPEVCGGFGEILKKSVRRVKTYLGRRRLAFAWSPKPGQWPLGKCHTDGGGRWKNRIERLCFSLLMSKNL